MIYVIYSAPWGSGNKPFEEKDEKKMMAFLKTLKQNHNREKELWSSARQMWRGHKNIAEFNLSVTFKSVTLWSN